MKLSADQTRLAYRYLQTKGRPLVDPSSHAHSTALPADVFERAMARIASTPDPSPSRIADAMTILNGALPPSEEVAERILWRALADSLK